MTITLESVSLKLTLTQKFLDRPFANSVVEPFLNAFNKKRPDCPPITPDDLEAVFIDDEKVENIHVRTNDLLPKDEMEANFYLPGTSPAPSPALPHAATEEEDSEEEELLIEDN